ncbi:DEAD/SNF2-like helicase [Yasminevirus sp. GU-2018]|uniref:DEAD/SNF2-like helicase n=1 Tax=Yasminevirus sp. GU-2018 TaxID=2420051 RepID=A0A5K0U8T0_9VIRU|nr:DEAD/SNF2-like helicase [Yasminevirus sp. GU-2018]
MNLSEHLRNKINLRALELFEKAHTNNDLANLDIKKSIQEKLLPYQTLHVFNMITAVKNNKVSLDGSYTGTGKTHCTVATCAQLNLVPFVICPKSIMSAWKRVLEYFGVEYIAIVNYESIRSLKYKDASGKKVTCPYVTKVEGKGFVWDFSSHPRGKDVVMVFDEVHRCKNHKSLNGRLLLSCRDRKTIMLSATLCDKKADFGIFGMMLGFYKKYTQGKAWMDSIIREDKNKVGKNKGNTLHKYLFPEKGSRMALEDLGDAFPMNQISVECHNLDSDAVIKINRYYKQISEDQKEGKNKLTEINEMRQKIENLKVDALFDLMFNYHEQDKSVVVFVNYISTFDMLIALLKKSDIPYAEINGKQDDDERQENIDRFQNNDVRMIVCMIQAGGTTISLHDVTGRFPRVSIISPSYSRIELIQALGRIYRSGCKSPCLQKIVYCADTCEADIAKVLASKKETLDKVTDEELDTSKYLQFKDDNKGVSKDRSQSAPVSKTVGKTTGDSSNTNSSTKSVKAETKSGQDTKTVVKATTQSSSKTTSKTAPIQSKPNTANKSVVDSKEIVSRRVIKDDYSDDDSNEKFEDDKPVQRSNKNSSVKPSVRPSTQTYPSTQQNKKREKMVIL